VLLWQEEIFSLLYVGEYMKGSEILFSTLREYGVDTMYGIVGREAEVIAFDQAGIEFVLTHDERSAAFMADVHGRITGSLGVCYSTFGPGATNLVTGVASAYSDRAPLLAISAQVQPNQIHCSTHQYIDQVALMKPVTKYACEVTHISALRREIIKAIQIAQEGIPGPCFLSIPLTLFREEYSEDVISSVLREKIIDIRVVDNVNALNSPDAFLKMFQKHAHPLFIVGHGIDHEEIYLSLSALISDLKTPFFTTYSAKGDLPATHPCYLGTISNYITHLLPDLCDTLFSEFDLVVLIGVDMVEGIPTSLFNSKNRPTFCALNSNIKAAEISRMDYTFSIPFDILFKDWRKKIISVDDGSSHIGEYKALIKKAKNDIVKNTESIDPAHVVYVVQEVLSDSDILVSDVGLHKQYFSLLYDVVRPKRFFCSNGLGSMGFGLPAAIAAKRLYPNDTVVLVCGDGGFHMSSSELETTVRYGLPIVIILFCDRSLGLIRHYQNKGFTDGDHTITHYGPVDFVKLAEANGCQGFRVTHANDLPHILKTAIDSYQTTLIEIPVMHHAYI